MTLGSSPTNLLRTKLGLLLLLLKMPGLLLEPRHLYLDLSRHVVRIFSTLCLHGHIR